MCASLGGVRSHQRQSFFFGPSEVIRDDPSFLGRQRLLELLLTVWRVGRHRSNVYFFWRHVHPGSSEVILLFGASKVLRGDFSGGVVEGLFFEAFWIQESLCLGGGIYCLILKFLQS